MALRWKLLGRSILIYGATTQSRPRLFVRDKSLGRIRDSLNDVLPTGHHGIGLVHTQKRSKNYLDKEPNFLGPSRYFGTQGPSSWR